MKHYRVLPLLLALALLLTLSPALAADNTRTGPLGEDALPTLLDTGRGYIAYYFYASAIYWSPDGVTWTDLSDRSWVQEARGYIGRALGHREFQVIWTGTEYMLRQDLRDDARSAYQTIGDSPRNSTVTFLDEDFQIIGELPLGGAVTDIRYEDDAYYATVDGNEVAFTREEWLPKDLTTEFSDVPADAWYAQGVALCAEKGIMVGTGEGKFSPDRELTQAECLTLAFRLYDLTQGREHTIEAAPEDWGRMTLTLADGMVYEGYGYLGSEETRTFDWWEWRNGVKGLCAQVPGWSYEDVDASVRAQRAWMEAHPDICGPDDPATLTLNGVTYQGTTLCWMPVGPYVFMFQPELDQANEVNALLHHAIYREMGPDRWWQDVCYTIVQRELEDIFDPYEFQDNFACRSFFARVLAAGCKETLEKRLTVEAIPDLSREYAGGILADQYREAVYTLYEAGILTGTDEFGTFYADGALTRAQAAVIVARVLDESLRVSDPPTSLPNKGYTLTVLGDEPTGTVWQGGRSVGDGLAVFYTDEGQGPIWTLYTKAGHRLTLEDRPYHWDDGLLVLDRGQADQRFGVMDLKSLEMVVPFGPYEHCMIQEDGFHQSGFYILTDDPSTDLPSYLAWDREGRNIATMDYATMEWQRGFANGLHRQKPSEDGLYGYVDPSYQFVIPPQWADAASFRDGYAAVAVAGDSGLVWGVIDTQGNQVVPPRYEYLENRGQGVFLTGDNAGSLYGLLFAGTEGQPQLPLAQTNCVLSFPFQNGYGVYELGDGAGAYYMDLTGQQASQVFDWAGPVDADGSALVGLNGYIYRLDFRR